jgi:hypothetical protein
MPKITPEAIEVFRLASATAHKKLDLLTPEQKHDLAYEALFYAAVAQELYDRTPPEQRNEYARGYLAATQDILSALATP